jgi:small subunit ribosomal protein S20
MPHTASAKKRLRQSEKRRERNRSTIKSLKTFLRRVETAVAAGDATKLQEECSLAAKKHDQAAAKGIIHKNRASRVKSHLATAMAKLAKGAPGAKTAAK